MLGSISVPPFYGNPYKTISHMGIQGADEGLDPKH